MLGLDGGKNYLLVWSLRFIVTKIRKADKQSRSSFFVMLKHCRLWKRMPMAKPTHGEKYITTRKRKTKQNNKESSTSTQSDTRKENLFLLRGRLYQLQIWFAHLKVPQWTENREREQQANPIGTFSALYVIHLTAHAFRFTHNTHKMNS